ncbi:TIGR02234 family membrane protein [Peterkaempfera bronchialis]|uniref:TIGR02234 family membrane protein n=1 Tax=Peterkaempfera bronchialis TaxID=2126346 RepID=A0A345STI9_9ACTN|nr:TIGR02234 family membrane protein [Peterkaempfera bronchialis]AXI77044.1 TIGR02234 family membrane protein [Peterkaempfera bronchialis]
MNAQPEPRTAEPRTAEAPAAPQADRAAARRSLALMLLLTVAGAVLVLWATGRTWAEGGATGLGPARLTATGHDISGLPGALALVGLASSVAVFAVRRAGRLAVGALVALAGAGAAVAAVLGATDTSAVDAKAARSLALTTATADHITHTAWPWLAAAGGVLLCAAGLLTLVRGRAWPGMSSKYDAPAARARTPRRRATTPADLWNALDRGEDPTTPR